MILPALRELANAPIIRPLDLALKDQLIADSLARLPEAEASSPSDALPEMPHSEKKAVRFP